MILPACGGIHACNFRHRSGARADEDKDDYETVYKSYGSSRGDRESHGGGDTGPTIADIPSRSDDCQSTDVARGFGLKVEACEIEIGNGPFAVGCICYR
jgi:hypothetical protein